MKEAGEEEKGVEEEEEEEAVAGSDVGVVSSRTLDRRGGEASAGRRGQQGSTAVVTSSVTPASTGCVKNTDGSAGRRK